MHDVLEGCAQYEVKELLKYLIAETYVTLEYVNKQIDTFLYAPPDALNKPTPISAKTMKSRDHSIKQKGTLVYSSVHSRYTYTIIELEIFADKIW